MLYRAALAAAALLLAALPLAGMAGLSPEAGGTESAQLRAAAAPEAPAPR